LKKLSAEFLGTAFLVVAVVGSGIMGERLAGGNVAIALIANTLATGAALLALILTCGDLSGAQFNPAVSLVAAMRGLLPWRQVAPYTTAQISGGYLGTVTAQFKWAAS
jgi:glycerol uptake facilitator-like aquaporin